MLYSFLSVKLVSFSGKMKPQCSAVCVANMLVSVFPFFVRNGLGPSKEGEAQYSVVHCTGYIKAWPPAGKQEHTHTYHTSTESSCK